METIRNNEQRSKNALIAFLIFGIAYLTSIGISLYQNSVLKNYPDNIDKIEFTDMLTSIIAIIQVSSFIVCIVLFLMWFRRAYGNLIRLNYNSLEYSETGSVWGYFIPFVNWVRPISTTKEIFINTQRAIKRHNDQYSMQQETSFINFWWITYIISGGIDNFASRSFNRANDIPSYIEANNMMMISDLISFIPLALVIYVVIKISKLESLLLETHSSRSVIDEIGMKED